MRKLVDCLDRGEVFKVNILSAVLTLSTAWQSVGQNVLQSSFRRAQLLKAGESLQVEVVADEVMVWDERFGCEVSFEDFVDADRNQGWGI